MNIRSSANILFLLASPLIARPSIDKLVMKNGDTFTCEIKKLDKGVLYVGMGYVDGTVSVRWMDVARVESAQLFLVSTQNGAVYRGTLRTAESPADQPVMIEVEEPQQAHEVLAQGKIVEAQQTSASFFRRFKGSIDSGITYAKGNNSTQYNLGSDLTYRKETWSASGNFSSALSHNTGATTTTWNQLNLDGMHLMRRSEWFYAGLGSFLESSQQGIDRQTTLGGGIGRYLKRTNRALIALTGGFVWQEKLYRPGSEPVGQQQSIAGLIAGNVEAFKFKKTSLSITANFFPLLSQPGRFGLTMNASYSIQIINNLWWKLSFYGNWDNKPPQNFSGSDYGTTSSLSYSFN